MISKDILKQIKHIEILVSRLVSNTMIGHYGSIFKGNGLEFSEVREYQYGDDIRSIDWNVSARHGKPFIKKFVEERELNVIIMIDMSASMGFSTKKKTKHAIAAEIAALLAFSAIKNNDKVGLLLFSDKVEAYLAPSRQKHCVLRMLREILCYEKRQKKTDLKFALNYLNQAFSKECILFLISDFWVDDYENELKRIHKKNEIIPILLSDHRERVFPNLKFLNLEDLETGKIGSFQATSSSIEQLKCSYDNFLKKRLKIFKRLSLDCISLTTDQSHFNEIIAFFRKRASQ